MEDVLRPIELFVRNSPKVRNALKTSLVFYVYPCQQCMYVYSMYICMLRTLNLQDLLISFFPETSLLGFPVTIYIFTVSFGSTLIHLRCLNTVQHVHFLTKP